MIFNQISSKSIKAYKTLLCWSKTAKITYFTRFSSFFDQRLKKKLSITSFSGFFDQRIKKKRCIKSFSSFFDQKIKKKLCITSFSNFFDQKSKNKLCITSLSSFFDQKSKKKLCITSFPSFWNDFPSIGRRAPGCPDVLRSLKARKAQLFCNKTAKTIVFPSFSSFFW